MTSRSVRHRLGRRWASAPAVGAVVVELRDFATGISQSFLIMPGSEHRVELTGMIQGASMPRVIRVPLTVKAHVA